MKIGLSLGGGGAKGAYQVGVLKALEEYNLIEAIEVFSGVSIGALNAYFYLSSFDSQSLYDAWIYGINNNPFKDGVSFLDKESRGLYKMDVIKDMADLYSSKDIFLENSKDLYVVLTKVSEPNLRTLLRKTNREKVIVHVNEKEKQLDYVLSSASIPVFFGFQEVEDNYYIDGGISDNNPIMVLVEKGANIIFHSSFQKKIDLDYYQDKNVTLIELTSMNAMPALRLSRFLSSIDFDVKLFDKRVKYGYFVAKSMIKYLIKTNFLVLKDSKYVFSKLEGFHNITIPEDIHEEVKKMYKEK